MKSDINHSMVDHPLDMFMALVGAVLIGGALLHLAALQITPHNEAYVITGLVTGLGMLTVDVLAFARSFCKWQYARIEAQERDDA